VQFSVCTFKEDLFLFFHIASWLNGISLMLFRAYVIIRLFSVFIFICIFFVWLLMLLRSFVTRCTRSFFFFFFAVIHPLRFVFYRRYFHPTDEHTLHSCCSHLSRKTAGIWIYVRYSCRITARTSRGFRKRSCARFMAVVFLSRIGMNAPSPLTHAKSKLLLFNSQQLYSKRKRSRFNENIIVK